MSSKTKNPASALIGGGSYHNIVTLRPVSTGEQFRLDPFPVSKLSLLVTNAVFALFFGGMLWLSSSRDLQFAILAIIPVWVLTSACYTGLVCHFHRKSISMGSAFVYYRKSGKIELPRHNVSLSSSDDVWIESLTASSENDIHGEK